MQAIYSSNQQNKIHHNFYIPERNTEVKATLLLLHGMSEHSGRYTEFSEYLASHGIAVLTYDHLGHGYTSNSIEDLGFFTKDYPFQSLLKDTIIMADTLDEQYPNIPHFILGHSMGSFIVRNVLKHHSHRFDGAIIMGTSDKDILIKALLPLFALLNKLSPYKSSNFGSTITNKLLNSRLGINNLDSPFLWISKNPDNIKSFEADPLCGFQLTNNGYYTLALLMDGALNMPWYENIAPTFPMFLISGENDPVGNMGKGINNLVERLYKYGFQNITKVLYPNMRHEILNESDKQLVFTDIQKWILGNIKL